MPDSKPFRVWRLPNNGPLEELGEIEAQARSLDQISSTLPQGVYTSFRTYQHFLGLHMADHFQRLTDGSIQMGCPIQLNPIAVRNILRSILADLVGDDFRFRLSVDLEKQAGDLYILVEPLVTPTSQSYQLGVNTLARPFEREQAETKYTRFIVNSKPYRLLISGDVNEVLLFNQQNQILEGLSSNFYGVIKGSIMTADQGILPGITRSIVLKETLNQGLNLVLHPLRMDQIPYLSEAFLTSASRAVLPIKRIENQIIGAGRPGQITNLLADLYARRIQGELEEI